MNKGNRLWINSEEMSISMLTKPSNQMLRGKRGLTVKGMEACHLMDGDLHKIAQNGVSMRSFYFRSKS